MTTPRTINIPLLRKGVEWVEEQDKLPVETRTWMQEMWLTDEESRVEDYAHPQGCGTAYCLAGWIAQSIHPELAHQEEAWVDGEKATTQDVALRALGLSRDPVSPVCHPLFASTNSAKDIRRIAEAYAGEKL